MIFSQLNEECGVFGVYNCSNAAEVIYYGLHALQHRGQEGVGIVTSNGNNLSQIKGEGLVIEIFDEQAIQKLPGNSGIGHVRYSTAGGGGIENVQPFLFRHHEGDFAIAHNGNIVNSKILKESLEDKGSIFQSTSDTEILAHLLKMNRDTNRLEAIKDALRMIEGAFAFLAITKSKLYIMRDKHGLRPLSIGKLNGGYVVSSETCALDIVGAEFLRDVSPGEIVVIEKDNIESHFYAEETTKKMCAMEYIYFSRPDSNIEGVNVHSTRKAAGKILAQQDDVKADIVIGVPDSSISAAIGYAEESNIPYEMGLIKNRYIGRTFIQPSQALREKGVRLKLAPVKSLVKGKDIILVDDSIVRGTTSRKITKMLREAGAKSIHIRIASPEIKFPCFYGVDTSTFEELISSRKNNTELAREIGADTVKFLSFQDVKTSCNNPNLCMACFTGKYPTHLYESLENANKDNKF